MFQKRAELFKEWLGANKIVLLTIFFIYQIAVLSIGIVNYPYIDDISRQLNGGTGFVSSYSRWGSEIGSMIVQGSRHLTDLGLTTHILTGVILAATSIIVLYCLKKKMKLLPAIVSTMIGLNPWFLACISFRFDSPYMALSVFFSVLPFIWWEKNTYLFLSVSLISLFLMCNFYQSSSGIYIVMVLALSLKSLLEKNTYKSTITKLSFAALSYIFAMLAYAIETSFNPELAKRGNTIAIAHLKDIPKTFISNAEMYITKIFDQSAKIWILLFVILLFLFIISTLLYSDVSMVKAAIFSIAYIILGSIFSYGVYLIFIEKLAEYTPRYSYGFAFFATITIIMLLDNLSISFVKIPTQIITCLFCYYILTFPFVYAASLSYQLKAFESQSLILATELKDLVTDDTPNVYANRLFSNSPVFENTNRNYPILRYLVPDNNSLYWPNQGLFTTITRLDRNLTPFNPETQNLEDENLKVDNYYYKIYEQDNNLYIIIK